MSTRVAYLVGRFPVLSETFVAAEIARLPDHGVQPTVYAFSRPPAADLAKLGKESCELMATTEYIGIAEALLAALANPFKVLSGWAESGRVQGAATLKASRLMLVLRAVAVARRMRAAGIHHLHAHWPYATQVGHLVHVVSGAPYSISVHAHEVAHESGHFPLVFGSLAFATFCNRSAMEYLLQRLPPAARTRAHLVYHGVDIERFAESPPPVVDGGIEVISAGRLTGTKGFDRLIRACAAARAEGIDVRLTILGRGAIEPALHELAEQLGFAGYLSLPGWLGREQVMTRLRAAHVFALLADTTFHDGLPNVVLEAMATGRTVVLSPLPAVGEAVTDGVEGFVVAEAADTAGMVRALRRLAKDPALIRSMGHAARARVERDHDARTQIVRLADLFLKEAA